jgi:hypothetical protein
VYSALSGFNIYFIKLLKEKNLIQKYIKYINNMAELNLEKDLNNIECIRVHILIYYIYFWHEKETREIEKIKLYKIYRYLVDNKPKIEDIFYDENNYNDILKILDTYKADDYDFQGSAMLYDVKATLIEKKL